MPLPMRNLKLGEVGKIDAAGLISGGGKSGLHRAKRWVTPRGSDPWKVPQKLYRPAPTCTSSYRIVIWVFEDKWVLGKGATVG